MVQNRVNFKTILKHKKTGMGFFPYVSRQNYSALEDKTFCHRIFLKPNLDKMGKNLIVYKP
jgi:hypothetical protein